MGSHIRELLEFGIRPPEFFRLAQQDVFEMFSLANIASSVTGGDRNAVAIGDRIVAIFVESLIDRTILHFVGDGKFVASQRAVPQRSQLPALRRVLSQAILDKHSRLRGASIHFLEPAAVASVEGDPAEMGINGSDTVWRALHDSSEVAMRFISRGIGKPQVKLGVDPCINLTLQFDKYGA